MSDTTLKSWVWVWSIHSLSAKLLNKVSNNWWKFWYKENNGNMVLIDKLRDEYRKKYLNCND